VPSAIAILDINAVTPDRREAVRAGLIAGIGEVPGSAEAWVAPARRPPGYFVRIIGPRGLFVEVEFTGRETEGEIASRVREVFSTARGSSSFSRSRP
jgi:hypothetical protein